MPRDNVSPLSKAPTTPPSGSSSVARPPRPQHPSPGSSSKGKDVHPPRTPPRTPRTRDDDCETDSEDDLDDDNDELLESMQALFVSREGVPVAEAMLSIAKSLAALAGTVDHYAEKMLKLSKLQVRELQNISACVLPSIGMESDAEDGTHEPTPSSVDAAADDEATSPSQ